MPVHIPELRIDPTPRFELSMGLYMQFMEPLGVADGSINAAWDYRREDWREDLVALTRELAPPLIRWPGGCLTSYYRWREGVGPRARRPLMHNLCWNGIETNHVGTHEYVDFCRRVGAESLVCVNFEADGRAHWARPDAVTLPGSSRLRSAGPDEAAAWVDYCNNPSNRERRRNGSKDPFAIRLWQIGNETSYDKRGYDIEAAARRTRVFAEAMRKADPSIELIAWGDNGWARRMLDVNGDMVDYIAFHFSLRPAWKRTPLRFSEWRKDPNRTWRHLMSGVRRVEKKLLRARREVRGFDTKLAITEGHWGLPGPQRCDVQSTWAAGVSVARALNLFERHGDLVKVATLADFCGTQWMNNAVMITLGDCFMMPVARVMQLYRHHVGRSGLTVDGQSDALDISASRTADRVFLHVANTNLRRSVTRRIRVEGQLIESGRAFEIAVDPWLEANIETHRALAPVEKSFPASSAWTFPQASVTAIELRVRGVRA